MGTLVAFAIVAIGILLIRVQQPDLTRPFRCPFVPVVPLLCVGSCAFLIFNLNSHAHIMFVLWLAVGLVFYFLYGMHNSARQEGDAVCNTGTQPGASHLYRQVTSPEISGARYNPGKPR